MEDGWEVVLQATETIDLWESAWQEVNSEITVVVEGKTRKLVELDWGTTELEYQVFEHSILQATEVVFQCNS